MKKKTFIAALFCCLVPLLSGAAGAPAPDPLLKLQGSASATLKVFDLPGSIVAAIDSVEGVKVLDVDLRRHRISLTLKGLE